jgi:hypothetical protein
MDFFQTLILALVQGITEFLPISSSAHLILAPVLFGWEDQGLAFDVAVHAGTLLAVVVYFRVQLAHMAVAGAGSLAGRWTPDAKLAWAVVLATLPVVVAGLLFKDRGRRPAARAAGDRHDDDHLRPAAVVGRRARQQKPRRIFGDLARCGAGGAGAGDCADPGHLARRHHDHRGAAARASSAKRRRAFPSCCRFPRCWRRACW